MNSLVLLLALRTVDYWLVRRMDSKQKARSRHTYLLLSLFVNLGVLFLFKYFNFFSDSIGSVIGHSVPHLNILLPLGLSFYTFHALSYTLDVYNFTIPAEKDFILYFNYVAFFPHFVAGPIARASQLLPQFRTDKRLLLDNLIAGSYLIAKGFFMKMVIADTLGGFVDAHFSVRTLQTPMIALLLIYFYAFQVYCDFAGYSLIARGLAKFLDFDLAENFRAPYFATSLGDFWKRWHISLTSWFRDYLFYPLVLSLGRQSRVLVHVSLLVMFALSGLWHGPNWTFIFWGVLHGAYLSIERLLTPTKLGVFASERLPAWIKGLITFHMVVFASLFFRSASFSEAWNILSLVGTLIRHPLTEFQLSALYPKLGVLVAFLLGFEWLEEKHQLYERFCAAAWPVRAASLYAAILLIAMLAELKPQQFLYIQF